MQRRAAAISAAALLLIAAGAYVFIGFTQAPQVDVDAAATLSNGSDTTLDGTTYTASDVWRNTATIRWTNESARYTEAIENNTTVEAAWVVWSGQTNRVTTTLSAGEEIAYNDSTYRVEIGESPARSFTLNRSQDGDSETFRIGDTLRYEDASWTVYEIGAESVTLADGDPYRVLIPHADDPSTVTFREDINVTRALEADPAVENTVLRGGGERYVRYTNGTTRPLDEYLPDPESREFDISQSIEYRANTSTISEITSDEVVLAWTTQRRMSTEAADGSNVSLRGSRYIAHFPDRTTVVLTQEFGQYDQEVKRVAYYRERIAGLWGVSILSTLAAMVLLAIAYLPSRY